MTLFKSQHKRYTNFAEDFEENDFSAGTVGFGQRVSANVSRYGDLVSDVLLEVTLPAIQASESVVNGAGTEVAAADKAAYWVNAIGYAIVSEVEIEIGGTEVDTLYSEWMFLWEELTQRPGARLGEQIGKFSYSPDVEEDMIEFASQERKLYVPLPFWFNKYWMEHGLSIPLIALTYHEIKIKVSFRPLADCCAVVYRETDPTFGDYWALAADKIPINSASASALAAADMDARLLVSYVYLDQEERQAFASVQHEYLITTVQRQMHSITSASAKSDQIKLYFNHPSNALVWLVRPTDFKNMRRRYSVGHKDMFDFSLKVEDATVSKWGDVTDSVASASLTLNGHSRFPDNLPGLFFRQVQPALKWPNTPAGYTYLFTFAALGGVWNPTSTLNMSRIDHVQLELKYGESIPTSDVIVFNEAYNLLVIREGMGGEHAASDVQHLFWLSVHNSTCRSHAAIKMDVLKNFVFDNTEYDVDIQIVSDKPMFKAEQVGKIIGLKNIRSSVQQFDSDEKVVLRSDTPGGLQDCTFLTEMGVYRLLMRSDKPKARPFQKWVAHVISTIRETGKYELQKQLDDLQKKNDSQKADLLVEYTCRQEAEIHSSLISGYENKKLVYFGKIADLGEGKTLIKIGSTSNIRQRVGGLRRDYGSFNVFRVFECMEHDRFERFLHQHMDIKRCGEPVFNGKVSLETYSMSDKQLKTAIGIASKNIVQFRRDTERTRDIREIVRDEVHAELARTTGEKRKSSVEEVDSNRGHCTELGPKIQIYTEDGQLVKTFRRLIDTLREWTFPGRISRAGVINACAGDYIYASYRWMTLDRKLDDDTVQQLRPTTKKSGIHKGWVALLCPDATRIVKVYPSFKKAAENHGFLSGGALQKRMNKGGDMHGYLIRPWSECSDEMQKGCKEDGVTLPVETIRGRHIGILKLDPVTEEIVHEYQTINEVVVKIKCANRTLKSAIAKGVPYKGFLWKYAAP